MGVEGLWKLIEKLNCGNPVTLESLENVILAIDCSIWLNQVVKGTREREENHHLLNLFKRICKLMHFKIKPVFVFDGGVPELKKKTIRSRKTRNQDLMNKNLNKFRTHFKQAHNVDFDLKSSNFKSSKLQGFNDDKLFYLDNNLELEELDYDNFDDEETDDDEELLFPNVPQKLQIKQENESNPILINYKQHKFSQIDTNSDDFLSLPPEIRHEILTEIKELNKFSINEQHSKPEDMGDYSVYQIGKLIKSRDIQKQIEKTREEMFSAPNSSSFDLKFKEEYEQYISTRIASDDVTNLVFTKKKSAEKPKMIKSAEKPVRKFEANIYGSVEDFDYDITNELDPTSKAALINERLKKKVEIKKEIEDESSTDDDFIEVKDDSEDKDFVDLEVLSKIHPALLLNENKLIENNEQVKPDELKKLISPAKSLSSPNKRVSYESSPSSEKKMRTNLLGSLTKLKNQLEETAFNVTINLDDSVDVKEDDKNTSKSTKINDKEITLEKIELKDNKEDKKTALESTRSKEALTDQSESNDKNITPELVELKDKSDEFSDFEFTGDTKFEEDLNKYLDDLNLPKTPNKNLTNDKKDETEPRPSTSTSEQEKIPSPQPSGLTIDFLENEDNELVNLVDKKIIDKITESPKKQIKQVELKPPTEDQLANKAIKKSKDAKVDLSETLKLVRNIEKVKRQTNTVAESIIEDTKQLLNLFGIPYVISPMEAEAQCAILEQLNLTKGTITEDSDVWLFGAKTVYKNFFNQSKFVMKYTFEEIVSKSKLTRDNLICFAMLTGSDYTEGIQSIGPVAATEIITEFNGNELEPLIKFKEYWLENKGKVIKKGKHKKNNVREKFLKYDLPKSFPNQKIYEAYTKPNVDESSEKFQFGQPDLDLLRRYTFEKFNWSKEQADSLLLPMFKRINDKTTQSKISHFFHPVHKQKKPNIVESKRLQNALDKKSSTENVLKPTKSTKNTKKADKESKKSTNQGTLKSKVMNQRKKKEKAVDKNSIFNKQIKISECFIRQDKPVHNDKKIDEDVICLSEESD